MSTTGQHDRVLLAIPEFAEGRLAPEEATDVRDHLRDCEECRAQLEVFLDFQRLRANSGTHVDPGLLVAFAMDRGALDLERLAAVSAHLACCPSCRGEAEAVMRVEKGVLANAPRSAWATRSRAAVWFGVAASLLLVALFGYAGRLRSEQEELRREARAHRERAEELNRELGAEKGRADQGARILASTLQPRPLVFLGSTERGEGGLRRVRLAQQPTVELSISVSVELPVGEEPATFELRTLEGVPVWSEVVPSAELRALMAVSDNRILTLSLPTSSLKTGRYELVQRAGTRLLEVHPLEFLR